MPGYRGTATAPPSGTEFILAAKTYALKSYLLGY